MDKNIPKPIRVQRKRTKDWKMPPNTIYVGRPTKWGNPYKAGNHHGLTLSEEKACEFFSIHIHRVEGKIEEIKKELKGKNLACFCPIGTPCHADILLDIANS